MNADSGCAVSSDGTLLDASEITWYNDADDETPLNAPPSPVPGPSTIHPFFQRSSKPPATKVAGARRSNRATRPSARVTDPNNAEASIRSGKKRMRSPSVPSRRISRQVTISDTAEVADISSAASSEFEQIATDDDDVDDDGSIPPVSMAFIRSQDMADADHEAISTRSKSDRTADVRTIFRQDKDHKNEESGAVQPGYWCKVCEKAGVRRKDCFFTGSISTLRMHIARNKVHVKIYRERCIELGIQMHARVFCKSAGDSGLLRQASLDDVVTREQKPPVFTSDGLLDYIVELIVCEDEAFQLIEKGSFRRLLQYCRPSLGSKDIPYRQKIQQEIIDRARLAEIKIKEKLQEIPGKVSFTFDTWTSDSCKPFMSITGHYIDTPPEKPSDWDLKEVQLAFTPLEGRHNAVNQAKVLIRMIERFDLQGKVGWFTSDGAAVNPASLREVEKDLDDEGWEAKQHGILCMEHAIHLAAKHFVNEIAPSLNVITSKDSVVDDTENDEDGDFEFTTGDTLGKAIALVKQIRASPQACTFFRECCAQVGAPALELRLWIRTRWASLYQFLDRLVTLRKGVDQFVLLADASDKVPDLQRLRCYADFQLTKKEWDRLDIMRAALQEPADAQQSFSTTRSPTVWRIIPTMEFLMKRWDLMSQQPTFHGIKEALQKGIANLRKWYQKVSGTSNAYFLCLVLDPNVKDTYARRLWDPEEFEAGMNELTKTFDDYYIDLEASVEPVSTAPAPAVQMFSHYGSSFLADAVQRFQKEEGLKVDIHDELTRYLQAGAEPTQDVIRWWGQHGNQYPTLQRIARDYLPIQGSATPSERAFSSGGLTGSKNRNKLDVQIFEALQILKSAYRNGFIAATEQAGQHYDALIASLDASFNGDNLVLD